MAYGPNFRVDLVLKDVDAEKCLQLHPRGAEPRAAILERSSC